MNETRALIEVLDAAASRGEGCALATIVSVDGSSYRSPGARMLISESGEVAGSVSAGCLETDVVEQAKQVTASGVAKLIEYNTATTSEEAAWGFGLGCNGIVRLLIEPVSPDSPYVQALRRSLDLPDGRAILVATVYEASDDLVPAVTRVIIDETTGVSHDCADQRLAATIEREATLVRSSGAQAATRCVADGSVSLFVETLLPPISVIIFGAGQDALPVVDAAKTIGWQVEVVDPQARPMSLTRFRKADKVTLSRLQDLAAMVNVTDRSMALVMTHNFVQDMTLLQFLVRSPARYIGIVGSRKRAERMLGELALLDESLPLEEPSVNRVHAPAGIDIGADGPSEIALSIVAEMRAVVSGRTGGMLHDTSALMDAIRSRSVAQESRRWQRNAVGCAGGASWASVR